VGYRGIASLPYSLVLDVAVSAVYHTVTVPDNLRYSWLTVPKLRCLQYCAATGRLVWLYIPLVGVEHTTLSCWAHVEQPWIRTLVINVLFLYFLMSL